VEEEKQRVGRNIREEKGRKWTEEERRKGGGQRRTTTKEHRRRTPISSLCSDLHHHRPLSSSSNNNTSNSTGKKDSRRHRKTEMEEEAAAVAQASIRHHRHRLRLHPAAAPAPTALSPTVLLRPASTSSSVVRSFFSAVNSKLNRQSWAPSPSALPGKYFSFPSFGKLITMLLLRACAVSDSGGHATVASRVTGLDQ